MVKVLASQKQLGRQSQQQQGQLAYQEEFNLVMHMHMHQPQTSQCAEIMTC